MVVQTPGDSSNTAKDSETKDEIDKVVNTPVQAEKLRKRKRGNSTWSNPSKHY